jgi:hypothetical protein
MRIKINLDFNFLNKKDLKKIEYNFFMGEISLISYENLEILIFINKNEKIIKENFNKFLKIIENIEEEEIYFLLENLNKKIMELRK